MSERPETIAIDPDDSYAHYVGKASDGRQFFMTTPFEPAIQGKPGREFLARFMFDGSGEMIEADITDLGTRATLDAVRAKAEFQRNAQAVGRVSTVRIVVKPFELERFGVRFGLIAFPPGDGIDVWRVELHPGNYMAFFEPWDSGEYDT
jgi:hypothetical protein